MWTTGPTNGPTCCWCPWGCQQRGGNKLNPAAVRSFYNWIRDSVEQNKPWDQMVREMYMATGSSREHGAINFYQLHKDPIRLTENTDSGLHGVTADLRPLPQPSAGEMHSGGLLQDGQPVCACTSKGWRHVQERSSFTTPMPATFAHPRLNKPLPPAPLEGQEIPLDAPGRRRAARRLADVSRQPVIFQDHCQPRLGQFHGSRLSRSGGRHAFHQSTFERTVDESCWSRTSSSTATTSSTWPRIIMNSATYQRTWQIERRPT